MDVEVGSILCFVSLTMAGESVHVQFHLAVRIIIQAMTDLKSLFRSNKLLR
jgi:hypothetical protein